MQCVAECATNSRAQGRHVLFPHRKFNVCAPIWLSDFARRRPAIVRALRWRIASSGWVIVIAGLPLQEASLLSRLSREIQPYAHQDSLRSFDFQHRCTEQSQYDDTEWSNTGHEWTHERHTNE
jgi:hypothetical protein